MAGIRDALGKVSLGLLAQALRESGRERFTGELRVLGAPGGVFHLNDGLVVAVESPGAPGPEALLLRTDRVDGEQWAALMGESGGSRWPAAGLVARGLAGAAELRVLCVMALQDAVFAIAAGWVDGYERAPAAGPPPAAVTVGESPLRLLQEAQRKLAALDALPRPTRPDRERPVPATRPLGRLGALQEELLLHADGRRTARDLAFRLGRGVYTITVEIARMLGEGHLVCSDRPVPIPVRVPAGDVAVRHRRPLPPPPVTVVRRPWPKSAPPEPIPHAALPRRVPGTSGITEALSPR
ncbi:MarR family transcriptional regulator [Streptomyces sp. HUAS MG47]|uniref:MarR family transcriptional regulator n=1 Tax=Streptomyces solicamelliae TaxID=3231716 RepID=UPI0038779822